MYPLCEAVIFSLVAMAAIYAYDQLFGQINP
jgi:hypothetical protein